MSNAEVYIILILAVVAYQLYLLLKIANKKTATLASEEHSTLYPVFTPLEIQREQNQWQRIQKQLEGGLKYVDLEQEELLTFKRSGKPVEEFQPSTKLLSMIRYDSERISNMNQHFMYKEKMIEANIAALNGASIKFARDEALKYAYPPIGISDEHFNKDLAYRREYWKSIYNTVTGKELYATE